MSANLCETCSVIQFDDLDVEDFYDEEQGELLVPFSHGNRRKIPLDYQVVDFLPTLPLLEQSAGRGCEFCSLLRHAIIRADFNYRGYVEISLTYHWGHGDFEGLGLSALVAELIWRPCIPTLPPSTPPPYVERNCVIFTLESDDFRVASWLRIPGLRQDNVLCDENIRFITQAIARCESECHHSSSGFLPNRLLDLGPDPGSDSVRLIITSESSMPSGPEAKPPRYAALSYCWGSEDDAKSQLCTKRDSIETLKTDIPKEAMSAVLWDAVTVCRSLGIRYLWIDALCILQDDQADWESESSSMSLIYSEAFVKICALSSSSCRESFLTRDRHHVVINFQSSLQKVSGSYSLVASGTCKNWVLYGWPDLDVDHTTWFCRGWTLQEKLMSRRRLFFGESMIHLECSKQKASENGYRFQDDERWSLKPEENGMGEIIPNAHHETWDLLVRDRYGHKQYTKESYRLPGILGLANYVSEQYRDTYLAGLWKNDLPYALLWFLYTHENPKLEIDIPGLVAKLLERLHDTDEYIAPSWSPIRREGASVETGIRRSPQMLTRDGVRTQCTISKVETKPFGQNRCGRIQAGSIRIQGHLTPVRAEIGFCEWDRYPPERFFIQDKENLVAFGNLDCQPSCPQPAGGLQMLLIASTKGGPSLRCDADSGSDEDSLDEDGDSASDKEYMGSEDDDGSRDAWGLLLHPTGDVDEYVRVGIWASSTMDGGGLEYFQKGESKQVTIV